MERVGVAELKDKLSRYLRAVERGDVIEVTDRDRPIARIVPATQTDAIAVRPARRPFRGIRRRRYPSGGWPRPSIDLLLEERQDR